MNIGFKTGGVVYNDTVRIGLYWPSNSNPCEFVQPFFVSVCAVSPLAPQTAWCRCRETNFPDRRRAECGPENLVSRQKKQVVLIRCPSMIPSENPPDDFANLPSKCQQGDFKFQNFRVLINSLLKITLVFMFSILATIALIMEDAYDSCEYCMIYFAKSTFSSLLRLTTAIYEAMKRASTRKMVSWGNGHAKFSDPWPWKGSLQLDFRKSWGNGHAAEGQIAVILLPLREPIATPATIPSLSH